MTQKYVHLDNCESIYYLDCGIRMCTLTGDTCTKIKCPKVKPDKGEKQG